MYYNSKISVLRYAFSLIVSLYILIEGLLMLKLP